MMTSAADGCKTVLDGAEIGPEPPHASTLRIEWEPLSECGQRSIERLGDAARDRGLRVSDPVRWVRVSSLHQMRPQTRLIVVVLLAVVAMGSHVLLERTGGRTFASGLSAVLIALVTIGFVAGLMAWARRR